MLGLASQGLLTDAFEKYVEDMGLFYDCVNEQFEERLPNVTLASSPKK